MQSIYILPDLTNFLVFFLVDLPEIQFQKGLSIKISVELDLTVKDSLVNFLSEY